jgi:integrase
LSRQKEPYVIQKRKGSKTFILTLNITSGLPSRVCDEWRRKSFQNFPLELVLYSNPKTKPAANTAVQALIAYLKQKQEEGGARRIVVQDISVGDWLEKFTKIETNPRTGINASHNRPFSKDTLKGYYQGLFNCHLKDDPIASLKMAEIEEEDVLEFMARLSLKKKVIGGKKKKETDIPLGGTRTFAGVVGFLKTAFNEYQRKNRKWLNPFFYMEKIGKYKSKKRTSLPESEMIRLFEPGVLETTLEIAVCAAMFLAGLRRSEVFALMPGDLDWAAQKITVRRAWQCFDNTDKELGPPKGKREREAPFDPVLQAAINNLWKENGQHEYVFSRADGTIPGSSWIETHFKKWLKRAGIELNGREIVPHSSRNSLATLLEKRGVPIRYIRDLLGHSDYETTLGYLTDTEKSIRDIGSKIGEAMKEKPKEKILDFVNKVG